MLVLALDTTSEKGGAAIFRDGKCLAAVENQGPANVYSVSLFQMVARALQQAGIGPSQAGGEESALAGLGGIDLFAVANGPGSFTGIRVGVAAVQAWAKAFGRPVRGVSVLEAMVEAARPGTQWAVPILDARRGEFFLGCFRLTEGDESKPEGCQPAVYEAEGEGWVLSSADLPAFVRERLTPGAQVTCLARESDAAVLALREKLPASFRWQTVAGTMLEAIAHLGLEAHRKGSVQGPADLDAYYIRRPDAELNWRG